MLDMNKAQSFPNNSFERIECYDSRDPIGTLQEDRNSCTNTNCNDCKGMGSYVLSTPNNHFDD